MCGIAGIYSFFSSDITREKMERFIDSLAHRGPDGRDIFQDKEVPCWLGHRRLSILDLNTGAQPMPYRNKRYWIVFNGEIYNFLELREELEAKGHRFHTSSDTEVLLASYAEWGEECQLRLNGMWAFAIWDVREKELFLSRDRFGVKPLYFYNAKERFIFASELKAFPIIDTVSFDQEQIANALVNSVEIESQEKTFLQDVFQVLPGHSLRVNRKGELKSKKWWDTLDHLPSVPGDFEEQVEEFHALFADACRIRARSDVPIGTALSGGIDSSSVFCKLFQLFHDQKIDKTRWAPNIQHVFSAFYPQTSQDESKYVRQVLQTNPAVSHSSTIHPDHFLSQLDDISYQFEAIFDLPAGPWLLYSNYRKNKTIISLDGHGADELFGGYHHYIEIAMTEALLRMNRKRYLDVREIYHRSFPAKSPRAADKMLWILGRHLSKRWLSERGAFERIRKIGHRLRGNKESSVSNADWLRVKPKFSPKYTLHPDFPKLSWLNQSLYLDFHHKTLPAILRNFDRCSMAHGVEIRAPFLDWRLVCFAFALPSESKIGHGFTKRIVRQAMRGIVPESILNRRDKIGFASPLSEWMKKDLKPFIQDTLSSQSFLSSSIWDGPQIRNYVERCYKKGDYTNARRCWEFVQADRLLQRFAHSNHAALL